MYPSRNLSPQLGEFYRAMAASTRAAASVAASPNATNTEELRSRLKDTIRSVETLQAAVEFPPAGNISAGHAR